MFCFGGLCTDYISLLQDCFNDPTEVSAITYIGKGFVRVYWDMTFFKIRKLVRLSLQHGVIMPDMPECLEPSITILPEDLKKLGYATHLLGKWVDYGLVCDFMN